MANLFVYGTLMCEDIFISVAGAQVPAGEAVAQGYRRRAIRNENYPGLMAEDGYEVRGLVYFDVPDICWSRLDAFEGDMYVRTLIKVRLVDPAVVEAFVYLVKPDYASRLIDREWSFKRFVENRKDAFINGYGGYKNLS